MKLVLLLNLVTTLSWAQSSLNVASLLEKRTLDDATFSKATASAQSLDDNKSKTQRIQDINAAITAEINTVLKAFEKTSGDAAPADVRQAAANIESSLVSESGNVVFQGTNPTSAQGRVLYMIPKSKIKSSNPALALMNTLTSYKRSAKMQDNVYEYQEAFNLTMGQVKETTGTESSWKKPEAAKEMSISSNYTLKKCRQLMGWRCVTSIYRADAFANKTYALFISLFSLENNPDHANFANDKRSKNQIHGSTALYVVKESKDWILLYGTDHQFLNDKQSFSGPVQKEFKRDSERFRERIALDFDMSVNDIK